MAKVSLFRILRGILILLVGAALATQSSSPIADRARADTPPAADPNAPLTDDALTKMLNDLGYDQVKPTNSKTGSYNEVIIGEAGWTFDIFVELSTDKGNVWIDCTLATLTNEDKIPAQRFLALLESNADSSGPYFRYYKDTKTLGLAQRALNHAITPKVLRSEIENFITFIRNTESQWSKWDDSTPPPAPKATSQHLLPSRAAGAKQVPPVRPK